MATEIVGLKREGNRIEGEVVVLDYATLEGMHLYRCKLVYRGGRPPNLLNCTFEECEFIFEGPALTTVAFLRALVLSDNEGGRDLVLHGMLGLPT
jgi:hypothetical protein